MSVFQIKLTKKKEETQPHPTLNRLVNQIFQKQINNQINIEKELKYFKLNMRHLK